MIAALPCPFCGQQPKTGIGLDDHQADGVFALGYVACRNSQCHVRPSVGSTEKKDKAEQSAIRRWNHRA